MTSANAASRGPVLALTTSRCTGTAMLSAALATDGGGVRMTNASRGEGGDLAASVDRLCEAAGVKPHELTELRLDIGPGSYVGLRVAVTFARFLAHFGHAEVFAATSLELMAVAAADAGSTPTPTILPVLDARRDRFHCALVSAGHQGSACELLEEPAAISLDALLERIGPGQTVLAAPPLHALLSVTVSRKGAFLAEPAAVDASVLFDPRLRPRRTALEDLAPLYLMASYAE